MIRIITTIGLVLICLLTSSVTSEERGKCEQAIADLKSRDPFVRARAAETLGELGDAHVVEPLISRLKDEHLHVRYCAAEALGKLSDLRAVGPLIACLKDGEWDVRRCAVKALGMLGDPRAVKPLIGCLNDGEWYVRLSAIEALGMLGDPHAVEPLIGCLKYKVKHEYLSILRRSAAEALGMLGKPAVGPLLACLKDGEQDVRRYAAEALDKLEWIPSDEQTQITYLIAKMDWESLVKLGKPSVEPLITYLKDENWYVRRCAAEALGKLGDPNAVEPLIECLKSYVCLSAAEALGDLGDPRAVEPLIKYLKDQDADVRLSAAKALGNLGDPRAVEPLVASLKDNDSNVRSCAAMALEKLKWVPSDEQTRITYLTAKRDWESLVQLGKPAVEALIDCLKDRYWYVRKDAALALGRIGDQRATETLIACLKDKNSVVRRNAAKALGELGDRRAMTALVIALPDWQARREFGEVLEKLGWQPQTDREKVYLWICNGNGKSLIEHWKQTETVLMQDISLGEKKHFENSVFTMISLGREEMIDRLIQTLEQRGNRELAEVYFNCGNNRLMQAAKAWAYRHGYTIFVGTGRHDASWGRW